MRARSKTLVMLSFFNFAALTAHVVAKSLARSEPSRRLFPDNTRLCWLESWGLVSLNWFSDFGAEIWDLGSEIWDLRSEI